MAEWFKTWYHFDMVSAENAHSVWKNFADKFNYYEVDLKDRVQTGKIMYWLSKSFYRDLGILLDTDLEYFFNFVKDIPYVEDKFGWEIVARPKYLLNPEIFPGLDCKKKAILIGAWAEAHNFPYRYLAVSEHPDGIIHHVFPQLKIDGEWKIVDATYPEFALFGLKDLITNAEELPT